MKKLLVYATSLFAITIVLTLTPSASAQISFGKMRDAAEKSNEAPPLDEEEDAFNVDPNEKEDAQDDDKVDSTKGKTSNRRSIGRRSSTSSRNSREQTKAEQATATNGVANAMKQNGSSEPKTGANVSTSRAENPTADANTSRANGSVKMKSNAKTNDVATATDGKRGPVLGKAVSHKYRAGMIFRAAANGTCANLIGTAPVPMEFPEQKVRTLEEEFPKVARVDYREVKEGGAKQLVFKMRELKAGQGVQATALFEVVRYPMLPPTEKEIYLIPKTVPRELKQYLKDGPYIESTTKTVRSLAKDVAGDIDGAWDKVAAILAYVRENIQYKEVMVEKPMRGAMAALKTRDGDCEDMSALFIALCRASDIPARLVRVPGHCWAEFYLVDEEKEGYWFPAQVAGTEELGSLQDTRVILQKGDNFRLPEEPKVEALYVKELFMGTVKDGGGNPEHQFIQETDPRD